MLSCTSFHRVVPSIVPSTPHLHFQSFPNRPSFFTPHTPFVFALSLSRSPVLCACLVSLVLVPVLRPLVVCTLPSTLSRARPGSRALISRDQVLFP
ncbi:hypothetical protein GY45DRAFT_694405 [Cubamyces sp. BRFM 1775]|nr:hypothetical protein GY45DRAFT_694405 [Cubamyces sp. BRFM 1775]